MMFGVYAHVSRTRGYYCTRCDIYGVGERCWSCGRKKTLDHHTFVPGVTNGAHHHDTRARDVHLAGAVVWIDDLETNSAV